MQRVIFRAIPASRLTAAWKSGVSSTMPARSIVFRVA